MSALLFFFLGIKVEFFAGKMKNSVLDFLSPSLIPKLGSDISACSSCNMHLVLITIFAVRAFPNKLSCLILDDFDFTRISTDFAQIALGVEFRIKYGVVHMAKDGHDGRNVVLHIWNFDIGNGTARTECLEFCFLGEFIKGIDMFPDIDMIGIGDVIMVCDSRDDTKTSLQAFSKLVCG